MKSMYIQPLPGEIRPAKIVGILTDDVLDFLKGTLVTYKENKMKLFEKHPLPWHLDRYTGRIFDANNRDTTITWDTTDSDSLTEIINNLPVKLKRKYGYIKGCLYAVKYKTEGTFLMRGCRRTPDLSKARLFQQRYYAVQKCYNSDWEVVEVKLSV